VSVWPVAFAVAFDFYVAAERRADPSLVGRPVAVVREGKVIDVSAELRAKGVVAGARPSNIFEFCPEVRLLLYRPERYAETRRRLLDLFARSFPAVEPVSTTETFLDTAGLAPAVCREAGREAWRELGIAVGFGLGPTKAIARAAGLRLTSREPGAFSAVPAGPDAGGRAVRDFWDRLPVHYLYPLPPGVTVRLERLGFGTIGEVRRLSPTELARQFGWPLARRIAAAASGEDTVPVRGTWPPPSFSVLRRFEGGLDDRGRLAAALAEAADGLARRMAERGLAGGEVSLVFAGERGCRREAGRRLVRPTRSRSALLGALSGLTERLLAGWPPEDPPVEMEVRVDRVLPPAAEQLGFEHLFGLPSPVRAPGAAAAGPAAVPPEAGPSPFTAAASQVPLAAAARRARRESLLAFYDPFRAGCSTRV